jgi:hypothetical protein
MDCSPVAGAPYESNDMQGCINAVGAWMRKNGQEDSHPPSGLARI